MFAKQYVVARSAERIPAEYEVTALGPWFVGSAVDLERSELTLPEGRRVLLIGHPIDIAGSYERLRTSGDLSALDDLAGTFIVLLESPAGVELRLDAAGSLPAVYAPEHGIIAANPALIHECQDDSELIKAFPVEANAFFPFDLTPKLGVRRLLPNHQLTLETMQVQRTWPSSLAEAKHSPEDNAAFIAERIELTLAAISAHEPLSLPLTAGYDSRALLACATGLDLSCITAFTSMIDSGVAYRAADFVLPSAAERQAWLDSTGHCVGGRASDNFKTVASQTAGRVLCMGLAGEVGRTFYSRRVRRATKPTAQLLLHKLHLPAHSRGLEAAEHWLAGLRGFDVRQILDLLYLEVRLGCWAGPQMIAEGPCKYRIAPFNQRAIFERALDVPYHLRRKDFIPAAIVRKKRRDLSLVAYNAEARTLRRKLTSLLERAVWTRARPARNLAQKLVHMISGAPVRLPATSAAREESQDRDIGASQTQ
jgi:hypothetical protein